MNSRRGGSLLPLVIAAILCLLIALGAALEGPFTFGGSGSAPVQPNPGAARTVAPNTASPLGNPKHIPPLDLAPLLWALGGIAILLLALAVVRLLRMRVAREKTDRDRTTIETGDAELAIEAPEQPALPVVRRGLDLAAELLAAERVPRDAIVKAWIGLQEAAEDSGMSRRSAETPTEFTSRVFSTGIADPLAARNLLELYLRARFGRREPTAADVAAARAAVARLRATWPDPVAAASLDLP